MTNEQEALQIAIDGLRMALSDLDVMKGGHSAARSSAARATIRRTLEKIDILTGAKL